MRLAIVTRYVGRADGQGRVNLEVARAASAGGHHVLLCCEAAETGLALPGTTLCLMPAPRWLPSRLLKDQVLAVRSWRKLRAAPETAIVLANGFSTWAPSHLNAVHFVHRAWLASLCHPWRQAPGLSSLYPLAYAALNTVLERAAFRRSRLVVAVSAQVAADIAAAGVPEGRIRTLPNGVDPAEFRPAGPGEAVSTRASLGLPATATLALFAGDLKTSRKNLDTALHALARTPGLHLAVAGNEAGTPWPALARALGVADRVHFLGFRPEMPAVMRAADLFLLPSRYEPFGLVLLEALASGLPVITTRQTGAADILTPETGIVLPDTEDADALAAALAALAADPQRLAAMSRAARALALQHGWTDMAAAYLDLLAEAARLAPGKSRSGRAAPASPKDEVSHA